MQDLYPSRCAPEAALLPRREPVAWRDWTPDAPLTRAQQDHFDTQGFLVIEDLFTDAEVAALQAATRNLLADPSALADETVVTERGSREVRSIFAIHRQHALMARLAADARLARVAAHLLGDAVYVHQSRLNYKPGFTGKEFFWHSDFETWHAEDGMPRMRALSMSVLLAENTPDNGPLMVMPGSHRRFVTCVGETPQDHYRSSLKKQEYGVPDEDSLALLAHEHGIVAPLGKPGTVILFDCNTMHGSNGNITPFPRSNAFLVYNAMENALHDPFAAPSPRPWFIAERKPQPVVPVSGSLVQEAAA